MVWPTRWSNAIRGALLGALLGGCFVDQPSAIDRLCPDGENTCKCLEGDECRLGLTCMEDGRCRDPRCVDGKEGCACIEGMRCENGLECLDASCLVPGGMTTTDSGVVGESGTPMTTDDTTPLTTTTPQTSDPTDPSDPTIPMTTDASMTSSVTGEESGVVSMSVTDTDSAGSDTMVVASCHCGFAADLGYFACGLDTFEGDPDPEDPYPFECPNGTADLYSNALMGFEQQCDLVSPAIEVIGCCIPGVNVWCNGTTLVFEECNEGHFNCVM